MDPALTKQTNFLFQVLVIFLHKLLMLHNRQCFGNFYAVAACYLGHFDCSYKLADVHMQEVPKLGKVLHATASSVSDSNVVLSDGSSLPFDYLVLASGSTWTDPVCSGTEASLTDRRRAQQACHILSP